MENFDWTAFTLKIAIKASLDEIYKAWSRASEIEKWFLSDAEFADENGLILSKNQNALKGDRYKWAWYLYDDIEIGVIHHANGKDHFEFSFAGNCVVVSGKFSSTSSISFSTTSFPMRLKVVKNNLSSTS